MLWSENKTVISALGANSSLPPSARWSPISESLAGKLAPEQAHLSEPGLENLDLSLLKLIYADVLRFATKPAPDLASGIQNSTNLPCLAECY